MDIYGNRISTDTFEEPLESNPQILLSSLCKSENLKLAIDQKRKCFHFSDGVINGKVGRHTIEVSEQAEYEIKASKQISFLIEAGDPAFMDCEISSNCQIIPISADVLDI